MEKREDLKQKETEFLSEQKTKYPELFEKGTFLDDAGFLQKIGFFVPGKDKFPSGCIKLLPQDFIVEEVPKEGAGQTVDWGNFFHAEKSFSEEDPTVYATLVKCGLSTIEAVEEISSFLGMPKNLIGYSGIKDKDALTSQLISFRQMPAGGVEKLEKMESHYFFLKDVYSGKGSTETGSLQGNEFTILVRTSQTIEEKELLKRIKDIEKSGFYNFYYLQRFGNPRLSNFYWGFLILTGKYEEAIMNFMTRAGEREIPYFKKLRDEIKSNWGNWEKIGQITAPMPMSLQNERKIISYLTKHPDDFTGSLNQVQEQVKLWLFALSSWMFNKKISLYLQNGQVPPEKMPLILSQDKNDWNFYQEFFPKEENFSPLDLLNNLKPFPFVRWAKREVNTREFAKIHDVKITDRGVIIKLLLPKGAYATTFLSHFFNLISGALPQNIPTGALDLKKELGIGDLEKTLDKFKEVIQSKKQSISSIGESD